MDDPPILVCADLQTEYLTEGRSHVISDAEAITSRSLELMALWRNNLWPVMHLKRIAQAAWFNPASNLTDWIAELKPRPGELTFEHPLPSAYSSTRFRRIHVEHEKHSLRAVGFSLDETILSTVVDGFTAATAIRSSATRRLQASGVGDGRFLQARGRQKSSATTRVFREARSFSEQAVNRG